MTGLQESLLLGQESETSGNPSLLLEQQPLDLGLFL